MNRFHKAIAKNWFFLGLLGIIFLGTSYPALGLALKPWINYFVCCSMLLIGFRFEGSDLTVALKNGRAVLISLVASFCAMPALSLLLGKLFFQNDPEMFTGAVLAATVPTTQASSVIWTDISGGNHALALVLMTAGNLLGVFLSPFLLSICLDQHVDVPVLDMLRTLLLFILLPVFVGRLLRRLCPEIPPGAHKASRVLSIVLIWITVLTALSSGDIRTLPLASVIACVAIQYLAIASLSYFGSLFSGLSKRDAIAVMFCSAQVTITFAAVVGFTYFTARSIIYVVVYHLFQQFMGQITARVLSSRDES